jgi:hypothetical protein
VWSVLSVDMFPHTDHCEMVVLLEREKPSTDAQKQKMQIKVFAHQLKPVDRKTEVVAVATSPPDATAASDATAAINSDEVAVQAPSAAAAAGST